MCVALRRASILTILLVLGLLPGAATAQKDRTISLEGAVKAACEVLRASFPKGGVSLTIRTDWNYEMSQLYRESRRSQAVVHLGKGPSGKLTVDAAVTLEIDDNIDDPKSIKDAHWIQVDSSARSRELTRRIRAAIQKASGG